MPCKAKEVGIKVAGRFLKISARSTYIINSDAVICIYTKSSDAYKTGEGSYTKYEVMITEYGGGWTSFHMENHKEAKELVERIFSALEKDSTFCGEEKSNFKRKYGVL